MTHYLLVETLILNYLRTLRKNKPIEFFVFHILFTFQRRSFLFSLSNTKKDLLTSKKNRFETVLTYFGTK